METQNAIQQIYIGLLGRAADQEGLQYWTDEIEAGTLTLEQLRANIVNEQPEYSEGLAQLSREDLVAALYENLFNREPDAEGLEYWVNGAGSSVNADQLVLAFVNGAAEADTLVLNNKVEVANVYTATAGADYTLEGAASAVADVDGTAESVASAKAAIDAEFNAGETFSLTASADNFFGTDSNDTFNATDLTLNAGDVIADSSSTDNDTLVVDVTAGTTAAGNAATVVGVENTEFNFTTFAEPTATVTNIKGGTVTVNQLQTAGSTNATVSGASGVTVAAGAGITGTFTVNLAGAGVTVEGNQASTVAVTNAGEDGVTVIAGEDASVSVDGAGDAAGDAATVSASGDVNLETAASNQVENLTLSGNGAAATFLLDGTTDAPTAVEFVGEQDVTLDLTAAQAAGAEFTDSTTAGTTTVRLNGVTAATHDLSDVDADVVEVAGAAAGAATLTVANEQSVLVSEDASAALTIDSTELDATADDAETLNLTVTTTQTAALDVSDFETVNVSTEGAENAVTLAALTAGATSAVNLSGSVDLDLTAITAEVVNASTYTGAITHTAVAANSDDLTFGSGDDVITATSGDTITLDGGAGTDTLVTAAVMNDVEFSNFEVLNNAATGTFDSDQLADSLIITGGNVTIDNLTTTTVDMSVHNIDAANVGFTIDGANLDSTQFGSATAVNLIGNAGVDTLTGTANDDALTGNAGADILVGAAGDDTITAGEGADHITGGAGADSVDLSENTAAADSVVYASLADGSAVGVAGETFSGFDTITGFESGSDQLVFDSAYANNGSVTTAIVDAKFVVASDAAATADNDLTAMADFTDVDSVVSFLNDLGNDYTDGAAGAATNVVGVTFEGGTYLYSVSDGGDGTVAAGEVTLLGTADATLAAGDIAIA